MRIHNQFVVDLPPDAAWELLQDVERLAPCLPGTRLERVAADGYTGSVRVKVGSIVASYEGAARFERTDASARTAQLVATGTERRGQGRAQATVDLAVVPDGTGSRVDIDTDLQVSGKIAQFGRGVMQDVSTKLIDQFATSLRTELGDGSANGSTAAARPRWPATRDHAPADDDGPVTSGAPEQEPVDLLALGGPALARRALPVAGIALIAAVAGFLAGRRTFRTQYTIGADRGRGCHL